jgi:hypothetical protein
MIAPAVDEVLASLQHLRAPGAAGRRLALAGPLGGRRSRD